MPAAPSTISFPSGYGGALRSLEQVRAMHRARYHPEAWRRIEAAMIASAGLLGLAETEALAGIGGGARTREEQAAGYARDPSGFARPGLSFHEMQLWADGVDGAQAVDWVGRDGRHHDAWVWLRNHGGLYGLKTFWNVNGEPWHSQMVEIPNSVTVWKSAGSPAPGRWVFPVGTPAPPPPPQPPAPPATPGDYGLWPFNRNKPTIREGSLGDAVKYLQRVLTERANQPLIIDGDFGPATARAVRALQAFIKISPVDGIVGPNTWEVIDVLAGYVAPPPPPVVPDPTPGPAGVTVVADGLYYVRHGDSPWRVAALIYGEAAAGSRWRDFDPARPAGSPGFSYPDHLIEVPGLAGRTTVVGVGEGPFVLIKRMYPTANQYGLLDRFQVFNGGPHRVLHAGDVVYLDVP